MSIVEKKLEERTIYEGRVFSVHSGKVELPNGKTALRDRIGHTGGAGILPLDQDGFTYLVRQYRYGVDKVLLEIPAGKLEPGEDPMETARRELTEEVGLLPKEVTPLGYIEPSPAYLGEVTYLYLGRDLIPQKAALDDEEFLEILRLPFQDAVRMVMDGEITDAKTQTAILKVAALLK